MPLKDCDTFYTSPFVDPQANSYFSGAWLKPMDKYLLPKDTAKAVYTVDFDVDFQPPYKNSSYEFDHSQPEDISPYGIAELLKNYIIKEIIAQRLNRNESTIETHRKAISRKLGVENMIETIGYVMNHQLI